MLTPTLTACGYACTNAVVEHDDEIMAPANCNQFDIDSARDPIEAVLVDGRWFVRDEGGQWTTDARPWARAYLERRVVAAPHHVACG